MKDDGICLRDQQWEIGAVVEIVAGGMPLDIRA
jgi:hypothetical protein